MQSLVANLTTLATQANDCKYPNDCDYINDNSKLRFHGMAFV